MFGFLRKKREIEKLKNDMHKSFDAVREDFVKVGQWITHIDGKNKNYEDEISSLKDLIYQLQEEMKELRNIVSVQNPWFLSKQQQTAVDKQTGVEGVQTPVQTGVQTAILSNFTVMERAIVWALLNSELKLSYEDLAALLGKDKSTIRGQVNAIKQKSEGLIGEIREKNGKKRLYIPENKKEILLKSVKVRVKSGKKSKKGEK